MAGLLASRAARVVMSSSIPLRPVVAKVHHDAPWQRLLHIEIPRLHVWHADNADRAHSSQSRRRRKSLRQREAIHCSVARARRSRLPRGRRFLVRLLVGKRRLMRHGCREMSNTRPLCSSSRSRRASPSASAACSASPSRGANALRIRIDQRLRQLATECADTARRHLD